MKAPFAVRWLRAFDRGAPDQCWIWLAAKSKAGYGQIYRDGSVQYAHRVAWELANGKQIPAGMHALHRCDRPACVNPKHLFLGTHAENMADMHAKGRAVLWGGPAARLRGESLSQSKLTETNVRVLRMAAASGYSQRDLAKRFGISQATVSAVVRRSTWRHV